jgi:hypothetical protein
MLVGSIVVGGSAMLMLPTSVFLSIYSVLMACMTASLMQTMMRYQRNQQKPTFPPSAVSLSRSIISP